MTRPSLHDILEAVSFGGLVGIVLWLFFAAWEYQMMIGAV